MVAVVAFPTITVCRSVVVVVVVISIVFVSSKNHRTFFSTELRRDLKLSTTSFPRGRIFKKMQNAVTTMCGKERKPRQRYFSPRPTTSSVPTDGRTDERVWTDRRMGRARTPDDRVRRGGGRPALGRRWRKAWQPRNRRESISRLGLTRFDSATLVST